MASILPLMNGYHGFFKYLILVLIVCWVSVPSIDGADRFPFVIPGDDAFPSATDMSGLSHRPAGAGGFVRVQDGHFYTDLGRLKIWGVNICFGANFPTRSEARKMAAHLSTMGVNGVRLHFLDHAPAPEGILGPIVNGRRTLDPQQLERQDYFLDQLHRNGIYANINLHVGRTFSEAEGFVSSGIPRPARFNKYMLYYEPRMRKRFKAFCRSYLTHFNPYRKRRRVDDPAIAMVEITNENRFSRKGPELALSLPEPYREEFKRQWNRWLCDKYSDTDALYREWSGNLESLGEFVVAPAEWVKRLSPWRIESNDDAQVDFRLDQDGPFQHQRAVKIGLVEASAGSHGTELYVSGLSLDAGQPYTLSFWARASTPQTLQVAATAGNSSDERFIGLKETVAVSSEWQRFVRIFKAEETVSGAARIAFSFKGVEGELYLSQASLRRGGEWTIIPAGQSLEQGNLGIPIDGWSDKARNDVHQFMVETELAFIRDMMHFLKKDLGVRVPITASQVNYHGAKIAAATCDYIDIHSYWQPPYFPRRPWDKKDWVIGNSPLEAAEDFPRLLECARWRMFDRPFTISEWNIPDPNDYAASAVPFVALVAALQDWDGVFFYNYHNSHREIFTDRLRNFFTFNGQPVKLALLAACSNWYRRGDIAPIEAARVGTLKEKLPHTAGFAYRIGIDPQASKPDVLPPETGRRLFTPDLRAVWDVADTQKTFVKVNTPASRAVWGLIGGGAFQLGGIDFKVGAVERNYAVLTLTSLDGLPLEQSGGMLLVAVGSAENQNMIWNEERTSIGDRWGDGPAMVNGISAEMTLPFRVSNVYALDGKGRRQSNVPASYMGGKTHFTIGPDHRTLWYEIVP